MSTDFDKNTIITTGGIRPSVTDMPGDMRTRIETLDDIYSIPLPYVGMIVYVKDVDTYYKIKTLKAKQIGPIKIENSLVDTYERYDLKDIVINGGDYDITNIPNEELQQMLSNSSLINIEEYVVQTIEVTEEETNNNNYDEYYVKNYIDSKFNELENTIKQMQYTIDSLIERIIWLERNR